MKKICIITTISATVRAFWGEQLNYLTSQGFDVSVICSPDESFEASLPESVKFYPVRMSRQIDIVEDFFAFIQIYNICRRQKFDLVQYATPKGALLGSFASFLAQIPTRLYLMWGLYFVTQTGKKRCFFKAIEKIICELSTEISPDSAGNVAFVISENLCPADKVSLVGEGSANGVDLARFNPEQKNKYRDQIRSELLIPRDAFVFGCVAPLVVDKGIEELLIAYWELANTNPEVYLLLVGKPAEKNSIRPDFLARIKNHPHVVNVEWSSTPEIYMAAMDVFVLPTYREGLGTVNIEASAVGLPVISTDVPGPNEVIINNQTGLLVPAKEVHSLQQAMTLLYQDRELAERLASAGRERAAARYEQKTLWKKIVEHRLALMEKRRGPAIGKRMVKRSFDLLISIPAFILTLPIMLVIAVLVRRYLGGDVIFTQTRPGLAGRPFKMYKFQTMQDLRDDDGKPLPDEMRLTKFGKILRATSFDELPELINVIKGEMSLVGPRPLLMQYLERYDDFQKRRHEVLPGITGWAQINGRNAISWEKKFELDVWYVDNCSVWLDIKILFLTFWKVIKKSDISHEGQATMTEFMGSKQ